MEKSISASVLGVGGWAGHCMAGEQILTFFEEENVGSVGRVSGVGAGAQISGFFGNTGQNLLRITGLL